jgi:hypothetical protein
MQDPWDRADHYRREGIKCHELAKSAEPSFLGDFYRRIAVRYMFMAEEILNEARARGEIANEANRHAARSPPQGSSVAGAAANSPARWR